MRLTRFLIVLFIASLLASCSNNDDDSIGEGDTSVLSDTDMPIVDENIELKFFAGKAPATHDDWNDVLIYNEYEDMTNIDIKWEMVPFDSMEEKRNLALSGGNLPDAFHSAGLPTADLMKYGEQGVLIPLNDLIDEYAPNFKALLEENPELEKAITMPDENIYSFPLVVDEDFLSYRMGPMPWINSDWLDELGMDMPETTDEFYEFLKASKEAGLDGDSGAPYGGNGDLDFLLQYLYGSFGVANRGTNNGSFDIDPETDELRYFPISDQYKEMLEYIHKLYDEELIAQNVYSIDDDQYRSNVLEGEYGATHWWAPEASMGEEAGEIYDGMPVLEGPHGDRYFATLYSLAANPGAFAITKDNKYPEATVKWIDYFYGEDGILLYFMGIEGETFEYNDEGEAVYMDHILNSEDDLSITQEQAKYLALPGSNPPSVMKEEYFVGAETTESGLEEADRLGEHLIEESWPDLVNTSEERKIIENVGTDVDKYAAEMRDKFITGEKSFDEWDDYVETMKGMNLDEYIEVMQDALDRYEDL